jgi:hypothetical protein
MRFSLVWAIAVAIVYVLCLWLAAVKVRRGVGWLRDV